MKKTMVWKNKLKDKHFWAFYYFCKRKGDKVWIEHINKEKANLYVIKKTLK